MNIKVKARISHKPNYILEVSVKDLKLISEALTNKDCDKSEILAKKIMHILDNSQSFVSENYHDPND